MSLYPKFKQFCALAKKGNLVPIYTEFLADTQTPVLAALKLQELGTDYSFLLESVEGSEKWATYSFLGVHPRAVVTISGQKVCIREGKKQREKTAKGNPLDLLEKELKKYQPVHVKGVPRFHGGAVGYIGYDCVRYFEKISLKNRDALKVPDAVFLITDTLVVFNNLRHQIQIIANAHIQKNAKVADLKRIYEKAGKQILTLKEQLLSQHKIKSQSKKRLQKVTQAKSSLNKSQYCAKVKKAKNYIKEGDVIQVVLSNRYEGKTNIPPFQVYRALRMLNPSPYMFYLNLKEFSVVGSSPETLVRLEEDDVTVRPIAGTRPRGQTEATDVALEKELLEDPKERAEHVMLVDLGRNDLGRIAKKGSVKVNEFMKVERYSHVMHLVSNVQAKIKKNLTAFDVLAATFPAGTLSGAPKVRAMEIIDELEQVKRGPYGGALGYFSFSGNMDLCITIRTLILRKGNYVLQAGAGIVADSKPEHEFVECENKAKAVKKQLN